MLFLPLTPTAPTQLYMNPDSFMTNIPFIIHKNNLIVQGVAKCLHKEITNEILEIAWELPYSVDMDKDWLFSVDKQSVNKSTH